MNALKIIFLTTLLIVAGLNAGAQNIDSLKKQLSRTATNSKALLLHQVARGYLHNKDFDSALLYCHLASGAAKQAGNDTLVMESMGIAATSLADLGRYEDALKYHDTAIQYSRKLDMPLRTVAFLLEKGGSLSSLLRTDEIPNICREALEIAQTYHSKRDEANVYQLMAGFYSILNDYSGELEYIYKAIPLYDSMKLYDRLPESYRQISINYAHQKKYQEAMKYAMIADSLCVVNHLDATRDGVKLHIAIIHKNLGNYDKAISLYRESLETFKNNDYMLLYINDNMGIALSLKGNFPEARAAFQKALLLNSKFGIKDLDVEINKEFGRAYLRARIFDSALHCGKKALQIYNENAKTDFPTLQECVSLMRDIYEAKGDLVNARIYDKQYEVLQDSIYNRNLAGSLATAQARLNIFEKDKELEVLAAENELHKVKGQRQAIVLTLGVLIVLIIIIGYRRAVKKNKLLSEQQRELQQQKGIIDAQMAELAGAAKMKSRFLANISHELRTPVTLLSGMLEMVNEQKKPGDAKEKERLKIAYNNSLKLQQMVEEILDLTRLETNETKPVYETKEIAQLVKRIVYAFETLIEKERLVLEYDDAQAQGCYVSIDTGKFEKVINNLVYNAVKFNKPRGFVRVHLYASDDRRSVYIDVTDSGIGIAAVDLPHIFEHFYQSESTGLKAIGAGIGLSLVKEFTTLMGGQVQVSSTPGTGTTFSLQFPTLAAPAPIATETAELPQPAEAVWTRFATRQKLLIVDDNADMRYYLADVLGKDADIATAENGIEALTWLENNQPDLVITDVMMPAMDGREFVTQLKKDDRYKKLPVITLTALADKESELWFLRLGVDDYIVKPFNADELRIRVYNLLVNQAERIAFSQEPVEPGDEHLVAAESSEAEEFRRKITAYVLHRVSDLDLSVDDLATELLLSKRQLYRMSKSLTGCSPAQLIKEVRLQKAYELLHKGGIRKLEDICLKVGYEKTSYFAQQFYERFGKRATDFML